MRMYSSFVRSGEGRRAGRSAEGGSEGKRRRLWRGRGGLVEAMDGIERGEEAMVT